MRSAGFSRFLPEYVVLRCALGTNVLQSIQVHGVVVGTYVLVLAIISIGWSSWRNLTSMIDFVLNAGTGSGTSAAGTVVGVYL